MGKASSLVAAGGHWFYHGLTIEHAPLDHGLTMAHAPLDHGLINFIVVKQTVTE
jgi:hypothetical protein